MPQPVSYNPGTPVSGSIQENNISYVVDGQNRNYRGGFGGLSWMSEVPAENNVIFIGNSTSLGRGPANIPLFYPAYNTSQANIVYAANTLPGSPRNFTTSASAYNWAVTNNFFINNSDNPIPRINADGLWVYVDANQPTSYPQTGNSWYDLSGKGINGTLINGSSWDSVGAISFDGVDDYVNLGSGNNILPLPSHSLEAWVKSPGLGSGMSTGAIFGITYGLIVQIGSSGELTYYAYTTDGASQVLLFGINSTGVNLFDNKWHHVICTRDSSNVNIYIDGNLNTTSGNGGSWSGTNVWSAMDCWIGNNPNNIYYYYKGLINSSKIYKRALSLAEVKQNYYQAPIVTDGLVLAVDAGNLVSYESGSTTTYSLTGSISGSLINGVGYLPSYGGAWNFDSVDDRIFINTNLSISSSFTIEYAVLIKELPTAGEYNYIFLNGVGYQNNGVYAEFGSGYYSICTVNSSSAANAVVLSNPQANVVYYATATYENRTLKGYINGNLVSTNNLNFDPVNGSNNTLNIGAYGPFVIPFWRFYNKSLSAAEVQQNYEATKYKFQGQQIVTNGLIVNLDAANKDSYPGTGTTWYDLSGNGYNGSKQGTQSPTYPLWNTTGYFIFSGGTLGTNFSSFYVPGLPAFSGLSVFAWVRTSDGSESKTILRMQNSDFELSMNGSTQLFYAAGANYDNINTTYNLNFADGNWHYMGLTYDGNNLKAYWEGSNVSNNTRGSVVNTEAGDLNIGTRNDAYYQHFIGDIAVIQIYNRTLSAAEITQNYNATKIRFGL